MPSSLMSAENEPWGQPVPEATIELTWICGVARESRVGAASARTGRRSSVEIDFIFAGLVVTDNWWREM